MAASQPQIYDLETLLNLLDGFYPRLLTQIDRDPDSPTYGSGDRQFWMYRLHDFDSGVLQQTSLTLAALAALAELVDFSNCRYLKAEDKAYWEELARAINRRTVKLVGRGGMVDEYYPGEGSFPATVFAGYAALKSALMLGQTEILESEGLRRTAEALVNRSPSPAANQDVAGAAFLALYSQTNQWRTSEAQTTVERLLDRPEQGGSFREYGGADLGYSTVTLNYLGYIQADGSFPAGDKLAGLGAFIADFVTPAGRLGGEFASRSTTYFLPFGILEAAYADPRLASRLGRLDLRAGYEKLDDRYLMHYCLPSLAMTALRRAQNGPPETLSLPEIADWEYAAYPEAHLYACRKAETVVLVGLNKGGAFQVEDRGEVVDDGGYRVERGGLVYATCVVDEDVEATVTETAEGVEWRVRAPFMRYRTLVAGSLKTVALRLLSFLGPAMNAVFKRALIKAPAELPGVVLERRLRLDYASDTLTIEDAIQGLKPGDKLTVSPASSFRVVPSAKFYQAGEAGAFRRMEEGVVEAERALHLGRDVEG